MLPSQAKRSEFAVATGFDFAPQAVQRLPMDPFEHVAVAPLLIRMSTVCIRNVVRSPRCEMATKHRPFCLKRCEFALDVRNRHPEMRCEIVRCGRPAGRERAAHQFLADGVPATSQAEGTAPAAPSPPPASAPRVMRPPPPSAAAT